jgi:hypothetical protein
MRPILAAQVASRPALALASAELLDAVAAQPVAQLAAVELPDAVAAERAPQAAAGAAARGPPVAAAGAAREPLAVAVPEHALAEAERELPLAAVVARPGVVGARAARPPAASAAAEIHLHLQEDVFRGAPHAFPAAVPEWAQGRPPAPGRDAVPAAVPGAEAHLPGAAIPEQISAAERFRLAQRAADGCPVARAHPCRAASARSPRYLP